MNKDLLAHRLQNIKPFYVMDILARAKAMQAQGQDIVHLEIGEPDFSSPQTVVNAGIESLRAGVTHYTPALGIPELRAGIAEYYQKFQIQLEADRIAVTTGASGALLLICAMLIEAGDEVIMTDPGYPCYRHFVRLYDGSPNCIPVLADTDYQLTASMIEKNWSERTKLVIVSTPSNPTGTTLKEKELERIVATVRRLGGMVLVDEIYQGLNYDANSQTALSVFQDVMVINSFSKYFGMTGWRLGWCVLPHTLIAEVDKLAQNFFLSPPTCSQYAALAALDNSTQKELERRRLEFRKRRDYLLPELIRLGFKIPVKPTGAFYIYADCTNFTDDSKQFANELLEQAGVAITPGMDFGKFKAEQHVRIAYTQPIERLRQAVERVEKFVSNV